MNRIFLSIASIAILVFCLNGCNKLVDDISLVKNGYINIDKSTTVGQAFDKYKYFKQVTWSKTKTDNGRRIVEVRGEYDVNKIMTELTGGTKPMYDKREMVVQFVINKDNTFEIASGEITLYINSKPQKDGWAFTMNTIKSIYLGEFV